MSVSAGLNGLAGPLHGLANQECLNWILEVRKRFGGNPSAAQLEEMAWESLNGGRVSAWPRRAAGDRPRFTALRAFGLKHVPQDPVLQLVDLVFQAVPEVLKKQGKAKEPWPNVGAGSGKRSSVHGGRAARLVRVRCINYYGGRSRVVAGPAPPAPQDFSVNILRQVAKEEEIDVAPSLRAASRKVPSCW